MGRLAGSIVYEADQSMVCGAKSAARRQDATYFPMDPAAAAMNLFSAACQASRKATTWQLGQRRTALFNRDGRGHALDESDGRDGASWIWSVTVHCCVKIVKEQPRA